MCNHFNLNEHITEEHFRVIQIYTFRTYINVAKLALLSIYFHHSSMFDLEHDNLFFFFVLLQSAVYLAGPQCTVHDSLPAQGVHQGDEWRRAAPTVLLPGEGARLLCRWAPSQIHLIKKEGASQRDVQWGHKINQLAGFNHWFVVTTLILYMWSD